MKLLVLSDLHLEFAPFVPEPAAVEAADVVVLAGDISPGTKAISWARQAFAGKPVVYVAGNHEFYRCDWDKLPGALREEAKKHDVHFLESEAVTIEGVRFLGATLWTDFELFGPDRKHEAMREAGRVMNDFRLIKARALAVERHAARPQGSPWKLSPAHTLRRHREALAWLEAELALKEGEGKAEAGKTVVVTHHLPSHRSVALEYQEDLLSAIYASELPRDTLLGASLWIHGHAHSSFDYRLWDQARGHAVRVLCNPRGYPLSRLRPGEFENPAFDPGLLVEV